MALLEGDEFVEISILGLENPDYKIIAISLEREQEKEIKYVGRLSKTQSQKLWDTVSADIIQLLENLESYSHQSKNSHKHTSGLSWEVNIDTSLYW